MLNKNANAKMKLSSGGDLTVFGDTHTFSSSNTTDPLLIIKNTTNDAAGARLRFVKDKGAAGADNDIAGQIEFYADDDNQDNIKFGGIEVLVKDASNGAEGGEMILTVATHDGENQPGLVIADGDLEDEVDVNLGNGTLSTTTSMGYMKATSGFLVPEAKSFFSTKATFMPLEAASKAIPAPVLPPPTINKSNSSDCNSLMVFSLLKNEKVFITYFET